ncbi:MAG: cupredoxin domain-containing protein [Actinobacteria bacterium]|nr:cupredoxin domain-containing protein [Actinomycetota bacterium]
MPRRLILLAAFAILASGCAPDIASFAPEATPPAGPRFVAEAVDIRENAGVGLGVAADAKGFPNISYLRLNEEERIPLAPIPADPEFLPAVMVASLSDAGLWTREIVAQEALDTTITATPTAGPSPAASPSADPDAEPPPDPKFKDLDQEDTTDVAVDGHGDRHVAWTNGGRAVQYAGEHEGFPSLPEDPLTTVAEGRVSGVSISVDAADQPWIAFYDGSAVKVATRAGDGWDVVSVADASPSDGARTDIASTAGGTLVAFEDAGATMLARRDGDAWSAEVVDPDGGVGVSLSANDQHTAVAYADERGDVKVSVDGQIERVGEAGDPEAEVGTGVAVDPDGVVWTAWNDEAGVRYVSTEAEGSKVMPSGVAGADPHLAAGTRGPVAGWYDPTATQLVGAIFTQEDVAFAVPSPEAEIRAGGAPAADCAPEGTSLTVAAPVGAAANGFDQECLAAPAGEAFTIDFDNQDEGQLHNVGIYTEEGGEELFAGEIITGPDQATYDVDALDAGTLHFQCDVHPTTMVGTFVVAEAGGGAGGASPTPTGEGAGNQSPGTGDPTPTPTQG